MNKNPKFIALFIVFFIFSIVTVLSPDVSPKLLNLLIEKFPNACIGYSEELFNIYKENVENIKNFNKPTLDLYYLPIFNNYNHFFDYLHN